MRRRAHILRGPKGNELPHNVCYVDTETRERRIGHDAVGHFLWFGWACLERTRAAGEWCEPEWYRFTSAEDFWCWLESRCRPETRTYLFAHNWSFDARTLGTFDILPKRGWTLHSAIVECPPVILTWRRDRVTLEMLDTLNWWRYPLAKIGESVGVAKLPMPDPSASRAVWDRYCRNDVRVLREVLHRWWRFLTAHQLGGFARTLAGQSLRAFRHRFMDHEIKVDADDTAQQLGREAYHGGRTECFRLGRLEGPIYALDVNSMYPHSMQTRTYPISLIRRLAVASKKDLVHWSRHFGCVARVYLRTVRPAFASVVDSRLCFPVGSFWTTLTTPEIKDALSHDEIHAVDTVCVYEMAPIFSRFVTELYEARQVARKSGDEVQAWLLKILMNSLYGKFGQRGMVWEAVGPAADNSVRIWTEYDVVEGITRDLRQFGGLLQEKQTDSETRDSFPAIAAHVTAYARLHLWRLMEKAGRENVYYVDTDSLYVNQAGRDRLDSEIDPVRLGALKVEHTFPWLAVYGAKDYETPEFRKIKGIRSSAQRTGATSFMQDKWSALAGGIRAGRLDYPTTEKVTKTLRRVYEKGVVDADGVVHPLTLAEPL